MNASLSLLESPGSPGLSKEDAREALVDIRYFARLSESLGRKTEQLDATEIHSVAEIVALLAARGGLWQTQFSGNSAVLVAVNQQMATFDSIVQAGDEIAFFPPVTGG